MHAQTRNLLVFSLLEIPDVKFKHHFALSIQAWYSPIILIFNY